MTAYEDICIEGELLEELRHLHIEIARLSLREAKVTAALKYLAQGHKGRQSPRPGWPFRHIAGVPDGRQVDEPLH